MKKTSRIYVAGHQGLVGSALVKDLTKKGYKNLIVRNHNELDLVNQSAVDAFFKDQKPEYVFLAAAKVGGIVANTTYRADFLFNNLAIQNNVIHASWKYGIRKLLFLGSTCIYPKDSPQPMVEDSLLTSPLEYTNEPYAIAKIAGIKLCESFNLQYGTNFLSVMPTNLYGPDDNFDLEKSHVLPALLRKMHLAKLLQEKDYDALLEDLGLLNLDQAFRYLESFGIAANSVEIWGSGKPRREFLWSQDMADACVTLMEKINFADLLPSATEIRNTHVNIGTGNDISIAELASLIRSIVGYSGTLVFNTQKPDGTFQKLTDVSKLHGLGWKHKVELPEGISRVYKWYVNSNREGLRT